jgi:hypothetical protein
LGALRAQGAITITGADVTDTCTFPPAGETVFTVFVLL